MKEDLEAFLGSAGCARIVRDEIVVEGADAADFLQGQLSQDIKEIGDSRSALSFVLSPDGRVSALVRVGLRAGVYVIDCDDGAGAGVLERLERFKIRVKVEMRLSSTELLALRGPEVRRWAPAGGMPCFWPLVEGVDVAMSPSNPLLEGVRSCAESSLDSLRILCGMPRSPFDLDEKVLPVETGLMDGAVSFTKGCYTGQELTERMAARGSEPPRRLHRLIGVPPAPECGEPLTRGGVEVGRVTSAAVIPAGRRVSALIGLQDDWPAEEVAVCLAYLKRGVSPGDAVLRDGEPGLGSWRVLAQATRELR